MSSATNILPIIFLSLISNIWLISAQIDAQDIDDLRTDIRGVYNTGGNNHRLLPRAVRLAFHDCAGPFTESGLTSGCNGCVDFENDKHAGLTSIITPLEDVYAAWSADMSRADFWAAAATIALEYASELDTEFPNDALPDIPYYFGRTDCSTSPDANDTKEFVGGGWGWNNVSAWFLQHLGFDSRETVIILGAHTLGKAHQQWSGYSSDRWTSAPDELNNVFYSNLIDLEWEQLQSPNDLYEWRVAVRNGDILMLNADICLVIDIDDNFDPVEEDKVNCTIDTCPASEVVSIVQEFIDDNQQWLDEFAVVFEKMITTGYANGTLTKVDANPWNA